MCRSIKPLFNFDPPATDEEVRAAALQFVRKLSGYHHPSHANEVAFNQGVDAVAAAARQLLDSLVTDLTQRTARKKPRKPASDLLGAIMRRVNQEDRI
jgi:hypothetical protein